MTQLSLARKLWQDSAEGPVTIEQAALPARVDSYVVLGEAGMGKTELLRWLGQQPGYIYCTARKLNNTRLDAAKLLGSATTVVIDALDELSVQVDGDAVDLVLQRLGDLGYPRFVLSCRVADWRNATAVAAISEVYAEPELVVMHLCAFDDDDVKRILTGKLGTEAAATVVVEHFERVGLGGLLANPQTLEMIASVANAGPLPDTKAALFQRAADVLRREHRSEKVEKQPSMEAALDAAGAAFAGLILTGGDSVTVEVANAEDGEIALAEAKALPLAAALRPVLGTRLFTNVGAAYRFSYCHRRIGEYLGARWLAKQCSTAMKRKRVLALFHAHDVVPSSIRGLHAWLATSHGELTSEVIFKDPMGVIEYGDADSLDEAQAGLLLDSLEHAAQEDPSFMKGPWQRFTLASVALPCHLKRVLRLISQKDTALRLRMLLLGAVCGSRIAESMFDACMRIALDRHEPYSVRSRACDVLIDSPRASLPDLVEALRGAGHDGVRLALDIVEEKGFDPFSDPTVAGLIVTYAQQNDRTIGLFSKIMRIVPDKRIGGFLDELAILLAPPSNRFERAGNHELTDLAYSLIARRLAWMPVDALHLWRWLRPFHTDPFYGRSTRADVHEFIKNHPELRRPVQRLVLVEEQGTKTIHQRGWRLASRSSGYGCTDDDMVALLDSLNPAEVEDQIWRDLLTLVSHSDIVGKGPRDAAKRFVHKRSDMQAWIDRLAEPQTSEWEIKQAQEERKRAAKLAVRWREHRASFAKKLTDIASGELHPMIDLSSGYLDKYHDLNHDATPVERLTQWLGPEITAAALQGFEAFLQNGVALSPATMASSHVESMQWNAGAVIVAGIAERLRTGRGFDGVSDERVAACFLELRDTRIDDHAKLTELQSAVEVEMKSRRLVASTLATWIRPQLEARRSYVSELASMVHEDLCDQQAADQSLEWLREIPDMAGEPETTLIDRLIALRRFEALTSLAHERLKQQLSDERRRNWQAVRFVAEFDATRIELTGVASADAELIMAIRSRCAGNRNRRLSVALSAPQLTWLVATFRGVFPHGSRKPGNDSVDETRAPAAEFLSEVASWLAEMTSDEGIIGLTWLRNAPDDSYTEYLKVLAAEQRRKATEERYRPPSLISVSAIVHSEPPSTVTDLQSTVICLLDDAQARIRSDPADSWRGFFSQTSPHNEELCRDYLLVLLGPRPESIQMLPEGHLANDKRADIIGILAGMRLPIEIKGQWHTDVWTAADSQLDRLYTPDYAAERRGIYLVLWFGRQVPKSKLPRSPGRGRRAPTSPEEFRAKLIASSRAAQEGRVAVVVLELARP